VSGNASVPGTAMRLLFFSPHCLVDPGSGAAVATRALADALAARGHRVHALCGARLDLRVRTDLEALLAEAAFAELGRRAVALGPARGHIYEARSREGARYSIVAPAEGGGTGDLLLLAMLARTLKSYRPQVALAYGGNAVAVHGYRFLRANGVPVIFLLHNFAYRDPDFFREVDQVVVPSRWTKDWYAEQVGIEAEVIPYVVSPQRCRCERRRPEYVTLVNPVVAKGLAVAVAVIELAHRERAGLKFLVVEGRGGAELLAAAGLSPEAARHVAWMPNVSDPRLYLSRTKLLWMPSLWNESFGLAAAEAMVSGIPAVVSDRGALPEVVGDGGVVVRVPQQLSEDRVEPVEETHARKWLELFLRLDRDEQVYRQLSGRAAHRAAQWSPEKIVPRWEALLADSVGVC